MNPFLVRFKLLSFSFFACILVPFLWSCMLMTLSLHASFHRWFVSLPSSSQYPFLFFSFVPHDLTKLYPLMHRASHGFPHHASELKKKDAVMYTYYICAKPAVRNCHFSVASTYCKCSASLWHQCCACFSSPYPPCPLLSCTVYKAKL